MLETAKKKEDLTFESAIEQNLGEFEKAIVLIRMYRQQQRSIRRLSLQNGRIWFESTYGKGSIFYIELGNAKATSL